MPPGPLLFFSGGSALKEVAALLAERHIPSVYLMSPFDSGGSSGVLRRAFSMPAVGDIRARSLSLAPLGAPEIPLFDFRLPEKSEQDARAALETLLSGESSLLAPFSFARRERLVGLLRGCADAWPRSASLRGANVGNLVLAALYLLHNRRLLAAARCFCRLVRAEGIVCPVADADAELQARLGNGDVVTGQHRFTGKFFAPVLSPIRDVFLTHPVAAARSVMRRIVEAGLVCYPVGSFYSSVIAGLLPSGVGAALHEARCPKVFLPNSLPDPELLGHSLLDQLAVLRRHAPVTHLLADADWRGYPGGLPALSALQGLGVQPVFRPILGADGRLDAEKTVAALESLRP